MSETPDQTQQIIEDDPIAVRRAKREALIAAGKDPYGHAFAYSHHLAELNERYADLEDGASTEDEVQVAGRVMAKRDQGKLAFLELRDSSGDMQLFCRINALGEEAYRQLKDLDVGDWIGVRGTMMRTKRGQLSVAVAVLRASEQEPASLAGEVPRLGRQGDALPPALRGPGDEPRGQAGVREALQDRGGHPPLHGGAGLLRG